MTTHWHILGAGAIGGLFAKRLRAINQPVTLLTRHSREDTRTLTYTIAGDTPTQDPTTASTSVTFPQQLINDSTAIDHLLLCTKSFNALDALRAITPRLSEGADVVLLGNGMGYQHPCAGLLQTQRVIAGSTTAGCFKPSSDSRVIAGSGQTRLGWLGAQDAPPAWFDDWRTADWHSEWVADIDTVLLQKVALNAVINPLTALHDIPNGALLTPAYKFTAEQAIHEVKSLLRWARRDDIANSLAELVWQVARDTASNSSSMRTDWRAGHRTEVDAILGYLLTQLTPLSTQQPSPMELSSSTPKSETSVTPDADIAVNVARPDTPLLKKWLSELQPAR